ncbi:MAG: ThuA domain-containing protein [Verrucomicrobiales bacterium]
MKVIQFCAILLLGLTCAVGADKKILLLAGSASHGSGEHEFKAGCTFIQNCLNTIPGVKTEIHLGGWPKDEAAFEGVSAVFIYSDGGAGHPFNRPERLNILQELADKGVGIGAAHYAVEVPKGPAGDAFLKWIGGYFEMHWSVNPTWEANFISLPKHPITSGVKPFKIRDEWYYHMRFPEGIKGVTPLLSAIPPKETLNRPDGPHSGNPAVRAAIEKNESQPLMWAVERPDGGRGFGFTGGHFHKNWSDENFRKIVLNAILWSAKADVPTTGVDCKISPEQLNENMDDKSKSK